MTVGWLGLSLFLLGTGDLFILLLLLAFLLWFRFIHSFLFSLLAALKDV
jgi:hypothetical protein